MMAMGKAGVAMGDIYNMLITSKAKTESGGEKAGQMGISLATKSSPVKGSPSGFKD